MQRLIEPIIWHSDFNFLHPEEGTNGGFWPVAGLITRILAHPLNDCKWHEAELHVAKMLAVLRTFANGCKWPVADLFAHILAHPLNDCKWHKSALGHYSTKLPLEVGSNAMRTSGVGNT